MEYLNFSIKRELDFMIKYQLSGDELLVLKLIFYAQNGHVELLKQVIDNNTLSTSIRELLISLKNKNIFIQDSYIPDTNEVLNIHALIFNKLVLKSLYQHTQDLGVELFNAYPAYTFINGKSYSLRNIAKSFKSFEDYCWEYGKTIKFNLEKHQEILNLLEYGKENNLINSGISDFVISRQWETIKILKEDGAGTFDNIETI